MNPEESLIHTDRLLILTAFEVYAQTLRVSNKVTFMNEIDNPLILIFTSKSSQVNLLFNQMVIRMSINVFFSNKALMMVPWHASVDVSRPNLVISLELKSRLENGRTFIFFLASALFDRIPETHLSMSYSEGNAVATYTMT